MTYYGKLRSTTISNGISDKPESTLSRDAGILENDITFYVPRTTLTGTGVGAFVGSAGGGVGALPGAAVGAAVGLTAGVVLGSAEAAVEIYEAHHSPSAAAHKAGPKPQQKARVSPGFVPVGGLAP